MWQITRASDIFFTTKASETNIRERQFPTVSLRWLAEAIERNTVSLSIGRPKVFTAPPTRKRPPPSNGHNGNNYDDRANDRQQKRQRPEGRRDDRGHREGGANARTLPQKSRDLVMKFRKTDKQRPFPSMAEARIAMKLHRDSDLQKAIGITSRDCMHHTLYGICPRKGYRHNHTANPSNACVVLEKVLTAST